MLDVPRSLMENKSYAAFFEGLRQVNFTKEETLEYFKQMTDEMCWRAALKYQKDEGLQEGRQEGLKEGEQIGRRDECIKMARAMKEKGYPISEIAEIIGLSVEEIEKL